MTMDGRSMVMMMVDYIYYIMVHSVYDSRFIDDFTLFQLISGTLSNFDRAHVFVLNY